MKTQSAAKMHSLMEKCFAIRHSRAQQTRSQAFAQTLACVVAEGVEAYAIACVTTPEGTTPVGLVPIEITPGVFA